LSWQVAILKILAAHSDGEALVSSVTRDLSLLISANDGWAKRQKRMLPANRPRDLFSDGLVTRPQKGKWRISDEGKAYLRLIERPFDDDVERVSRR
jgi:DNA-binding transcriptional ArsR family regulator